MEVSARLSHARVSPQKLRLVADQIRGLHVAKALDLLQYSPKKSAAIVKKVLESALANAEHNEGADIDELSVYRIYVDQGPVFKRFHARARGRAAQIIKRTSHLTITVSDKKERS